MTPDQRALAEKLVTLACWNPVRGGWRDSEGYRYCGGMKEEAGWVLSAYRHDDAFTVYVNTAKGETTWSWDDPAYGSDSETSTGVPIPDLTDDATGGVLLAILREICGTVEVRLHSHGVVAAQIYNPAEVRVGKTLAEACAKALILLDEKGW